MNPTVEVCFKIFVHGCKTCNQMSVLKSVIPYVYIGIIQKFL